MLNMKQAFAVLVAVGLLGVFPIVAQGATATATFTSSTDTPKLLNDTKPRGTVTFTQDGNGPITGKGKVTGLQPNRNYLAVPYKDGVCLPTPGVTAFPSAPWVTDSKGNATFTTTVNPQAINPLGQFNVAQTRSISMREVLIGGQSLPVTLPWPLPSGTPNVPNPITEACDAHPVVTQ